MSNKYLFINNRGPVRSPLSSAALLIRKFAVILVFLFAADLWSQRGVFTPRAQSVLPVQPVWSQRGVFTSRAQSVLPVQPVKPVRPFGLPYVKLSGSGATKDFKKYLEQEASSLIEMHSTIGIHVPHGFYFKINLSRNEAGYQAWRVSRGGAPNSGSLGCTMLTPWPPESHPDYRSWRGQKLVTKFPVDIATYTHGDTTLTVPTLLHEMCHAIHASQYGAMPTWLEEGLSEWYSNRPRYLSRKAKADRIQQFKQVQIDLDKFDGDRLTQFLSATSYAEWDKIFGEGRTAVGYILSQSLIDMLINFPQTQKIFVDGFAKAKAESEYSGPRTKVFAYNLIHQWPGGANGILKGWKTWHGRLANP